MESSFTEIRTSFTRVTAAALNAVRMPVKELKSCMTPKQSGMRKIREPQMHQP